MNAAEELVEAHVQGRGDAIFSQYRISLKPATPPQLAPAITTRNAHRGRPSKKAKKASNATTETEEEASWATFWIVALYIGLDGTDDFTQTSTWATTHEAPLILDVLTTKFSDLHTRPQQVALIFRIREAWGYNFYRTLRRRDTPILLPRIPAHGFLTQLAKLASRQRLTDFSTHFPTWLLNSIRNSNTPAAQLAAYERGEREVGRADIADYLAFLTTNEKLREEALHNCPRVTFNESNKRRRIAPASPAASQSSLSIEQRRRDSVRSLQEESEYLSAELDVADDLPPPYTPLREPAHNLEDIQEDEEELDIGDDSFVANLSDTPQRGGSQTIPQTEGTMTNHRRNAAQPQRNHTTEDLPDPLTPTAVQTAGATTLQARIQRRHNALKASTLAKQDLNSATSQLDTLVTHIHTLLGADTDDTRGALQSAIASAETEIAKLENAHDALLTFRATLTNAGVGERDGVLRAIGLPNVFDEGTAYNDAVEECEGRLERLRALLEGYLNGLSAKETAGKKVERAQQVVEVVDREYKEFVRTVVALGEAGEEEMGEVMGWF